MKYSLNMLKRFINVNDKGENIANHLITKTVEIEEIKERKIPSSIVIGKITKVEKHPDADKLNICMVDCGEKGEFQIICGGSNVKEGIFVPTALAGTFFKEANLTIEPRKMRGIESNGMICAKVELGIKEDLDTHGIWDMEEDFYDLSDEDLGKSLVEKYEWLENTILDADNKGLTHRPDLTGHFGMGVELNSIYHHHDKNKITFNKLNEYFETFGGNTILDILDGSHKSEQKIRCETELLNTYIALEIKNIQIKKSDFFTRLEMLDLESGPINNWVDFSNLFMNISGQPIHFFDADKIEGDIVIRQAKEGEKFVDLFEKEHTLVATDIVIADEKKILALGGVVGGLESGVINSTKNIIVEIGNFDPVAVRKTGVRLGLRTDAELRFEKNINPVYSLVVLNLFLDQLNFYKKDLGNFDFKGLDFYINESINPLAKKSISIHTDQVMKFIYGEFCTPDRSSGTNVKDPEKNIDSSVKPQNDEIKSFQEKIKNILEKLGCQIGIDQDKLFIQFPIWRSPDDINIKEDVYEEIARILGYDSIPTQELQQEMNETHYPSLIKMIRDTEEICVRDLRYNQIETYPWISEKTAKTFEIDSNSLYRMQNPLDVSMPFLRESMVYGLIQAIAKNNKFFDEIKIFDIGKVWKKGEGAVSSGTNVKDPETNIDSSDKPQNDKISPSNNKKYATNIINEKSVLGMVFWKNKVENWKEDTLISIKGEITTLLDSLGLQGKLEYQATENGFAHPKKQGNILLNRKTIGRIITLHPSLFAEYKINEESEMTYAELDLSLLDEIQQTMKAKVKSYETLQDQIIWRDLCFVVDSSENFDKILTATQSVREVEEVEIFDLYEGEHLPEGKKSLAFKFKIKGEKLSTEDINQVMKTVIEKVEKTGAKLR